MRRPVSTAGDAERGSGVAATARTSTFSGVTAPGTADLTCSLMWLAASSDSYMIIVSPVLSLIVQYPVTNPGVCEAQGTS